MKVHFYYDLAEYEIDDWDPDQNPRKYSDGFSHNILELAVRLRTLGHETTCGPLIPPKTDLLCLYKAELDIANFSFQKCWNFMKYKTIHIRSDLAIRSILQFPTHLTIAPNRQMENRVRHKYLPPLPQRGLVKSQRKLSDLLVNLTIKCNPETIPEWLLRMKEELVFEKEGFSLLIDSPSKTAGDDHSWNDFTDVDVSLVLRNDNNPSGGKPPTRLLNAWLAGTIPFVSPEITYLEHVSDGENAFIINGPDEIISLVKKLNSDTRYLESIRSNIKIISTTNNVKQVLKMYEKEFSQLIANGGIMSFRARVFYLLKAYSMFLMIRVYSRVKNLKGFNTLLGL
jgi:hypothetical protein